MSSKIDKIELALDLCNVTLALPRRNCDVGTPEELSERFIEFCTCHKCAECPLHTLAPSGDCGVLWSQMPYEEENK